MLPLPRTLAKWFSNSSCSGEPGVLTEAMQTLKSIAIKLKEDGQQLVGSLSFDEVAIRRHMQYDHQKKQFSGFIHYGKRNDDGSVPMANNVLVFMFTTLNYKVSIPISYYAITSLDSYEKKVLIVEMLTSLHSIGARVLNITFDGLPANLQACEMLGANLDPHNLSPHFPHPCDSYRVYVILDSCHMLKLIRNALGDLEYINDPSCGKIEWQYFKELESYRTENNYMSHKLTRRHIEYSRNRMNVRLATETFSKSVAAAMEHLLVAGDEKFQNSSSTINFIKMFNDTFDATNTRNILGAGSIFKSALNPVSEF